MNQHPGFLVVAFVCLGLAAVALWPSSPAQKTTRPVNIYLVSPQSASQMPDALDGEAALDRPYDREEDEGLTAVPDESATIAI